MLVDRVDDLFLGPRGKGRNLNAEIVGGSIESAEGRNLLAVGKNTDPPSLRKCFVQ